MIDKFLNLASQYGLAVYLVCMALCILYYVAKTFREIRDDIAMRSGNSSHYKPQVTVGKVLWRLFLTFVPGVNVLATVFVTGSEVIGYFLNIPLVPDSERHAKARIVRAVNRCAN